MGRVNAGRGAPERSMGKTRGRTLVWILVGGALVAIGLRLVVAVIGGSELASSGVNLVDVLLVSAAIFVAILVCVLRYSAWRQRVGFAEIRGSRPNEEVVSLAIDANATDGLSRLAGTKTTFRPGVYIAVVAKDRFELFDGRHRDEPILTAEALQFEVSTVTTLAGTFPAMIIGNRSAPRIDTVTVYPMDPTSVWYPGRIPMDVVEPIAARIHARQGAV